MDLVEEDSCQELPGTGKVGYGVTRGCSASTRPPYDGIPSASVDHIFSPEEADCVLRNVVIFIKYIQYINMKNPSNRRYLKRTSIINIIYKYQYEIHIKQIFLKRT